MNRTTYRPINLHSVQHLLPAIHRPTWDFRFAIISSPLYPSQSLFRCFKTKESEWKPRLSFIQSPFAVQNFIYQFQPINVLHHIILQHCFLTQHPPSVLVPDPRNLPVVSKMDLKSVCNILRSNTIRVPTPIFSGLKQGVTCKILSSTTSSH